MAKEPNFESQSLYALYEHLDLPLDLFDTKEGFTIFNLRDVGFTLPYQSNPYRPNFFSFLFVKDGLGRYTIDDSTFEVTPYSLYFTNPSNYRTFSWSQVEDICLITFDEGFLKRYVGKDIYVNFPFLLTEIVRPKVVTDDFFRTLEVLYQEIQHTYQGASESKYLVIGHLLAVLLFRIKEHIWQDYNPIYEGNRSSQIVISFKRLLEKHYRELSSGQVDIAFRVQDYAEAQNLHPNYLSSVIKSKTGKTISTWIAEKSLVEAKSMLMNSGIPIKEITFRLGFAETSHFSNFFKKHTGISPNQFRKTTHP